MNIKDKYIIFIITTLFFIISLSHTVSAKENTEKTYSFSPEIMNIDEGEDKRIFIMENGEMISDDVDVTWETSDEKTAKLRGNSGVVKAKKKGKAVITAVIHDAGRDTVLTCRVNVHELLPGVKEMSEKEFISGAKTAKIITYKKILNTKYKYEKNKKYHDITKFSNLKRNIYQRKVGTKGIKAKPARLKKTLKKYEKRLPFNKYNDGFQDSFCDIGINHNANTQFYMGSAIYSYYVMYKKDLKSGKVLKYKIPYKLDKKTYLDLPELGYAAYSVHGDKVAIECRIRKDNELDHKLKDCIYVTDMKKNTCQLIDYKGLIAEKYGICEENPKYSKKINRDASVFCISFLDNNRFAFEYCDNIYIYNIKKKILTRCIELKHSEKPSEKGGGFASISIRDDICTFILCEDFAASEFYAVDLKKMAVVSYVKLDKEKDFYYGIYRKGINYFVNGDGLYVYNPDTQASDTIYDKMEKESGYKKKTIYELNEKYFGEYRYKRELLYKQEDYYSLYNIGMECVFISETEIYLIRGVSNGEGDLEEELYKKIKLKL